MEKKIVTTEIYVAVDGQEFKDECDCRNYEQVLMNKGGVHTYGMDTDGKWHPISLDATDGDLVVLDTYEAYRWYVDEYGEFDDRVYPDSVFPAAFRYSEKNHCWNNWRREREEIKTLLEKMDEIFKVD